MASEQEPSNEGIDSEGIDAKGGLDTAGIYGFAREIIEKEEAQAPFRRLRLISYAVPAFVSAPECALPLFVVHEMKAELNSTTPDVLNHFYFGSCLDYNTGLVIKPVRLRRLSAFDD